MTEAFIRAFILQLDTQESIPLRQAQEEAMNSSQASLPLTKRLSRRLETDGYTEKERQGKSYYIKLTEAGQEYQASLLSSPPSPDSPPPPIPLSGVVLRARTRKDEWSALMKEVKERNLQTAFVPPNVPVYVEIEGELCPVTSRG